MTGRKHVNLFVPDSPVGAICSSVIHEWAEDKYDSVTVVYCDSDTVEQKIHDLVRLIHRADKEKANPCSERMIIVVDFCLSMACIQELYSIKDTIVRIHDSWLDGGDVIEGTMKRYFGFFKHKWPSSYRKMYKVVCSGFLFGFNWQPLKTLYGSLGADELEKLITAYLHDLKPNDGFNAYDMGDYYFETFTERKRYASNQTEYF